MGIYGFCALEENILGKSKQYFCHLLGKILKRHSYRNLNTFLLVWISEISFIKVSWISASIVESCHYLNIRYTNFHSLNTLDFNLQYHIFISGALEIAKQELGEAS